MPRTSPASLAPPPRQPPTPRQYLSRAARREVRRAAALAKEMDFYSFNIRKDGSITWTLHHPKVVSATVKGPDKPRAPRGESKRAIRSRARADAHADLTERARVFRVRSVIRWWSRATKPSPLALTLPSPRPTQLPQQTQQRPLRSQLQLLLPPPPPQDRMDVDERALKRAAASFMAEPAAEPRAKRAVLPLPPPGLPPPSLPPSPPSSPSPPQPSPPPPHTHPAECETGVRDLRQIAATRPTDSENAKPSARAALHAASACDLQCSLCTRFFPWLHNETDARCRTCDVYDKHVRRIVDERWVAEPPQHASSELTPDPRHKCHGCDNFIHPGHECEFCPRPFYAWKGDRVRLHSLSRADLNDKRGTISSYLPSKERWAVNIDGSGGSCVLLKGENLELVETLQSGGPSSSLHGELGWDSDSDSD